MRIVIDMQGAQSASRFRGIGRYSLSLAQAIALNRGKHEVILALNGMLNDSIEPIRAAFDNLLPQANIRVWHALAPVCEIDLENIWRREAAELVLRTFLLSLEPDVLYVTSIFEGYGDDAITGLDVLNLQVPTVVTLYDLIPLSASRADLQSNKAYMNYYMRKVDSLKCTDLLLSISEWSRHDAINTLAIPSERIINISGAVKKFFQPIDYTSQQRSSFLTPLEICRPFVFYLGAADEHKNLHRLIGAFATLPKAVRCEYQLVIAGVSSPMQRLALIDTANLTGLKQNELCLVGELPDEVIVALYNFCRLFVYPSLHEGFGLPVLEAMSCGAAVIASCLSSIPEIISNQEALFDPTNEKEIAIKMRHALEDEAFRQSLIDKGLIQAKSFSWDTSAKKTITACEELYFNYQQKKFESSNNLDPLYISYKSSEIQSSDNESKLSELDKPKIGHSVYCDKELNDCWIEDVKQSTLIMELINSLSKIHNLGTNESSLIKLAQAIDRNHPVKTNLKQLFVDVSELSQQDAKTGIQRVTRSILNELLVNPPLGYRVEPVYATVTDSYRYARNFTLANWKMLEGEVIDEPISYQPGDTFLGLDFQMHVVLQQEDFYQTMRNEGVQIHFVIYDLLCILSPQFFADEAREIMNRWLQLITTYSDGVICISKAVADELSNWLKNTPPARERSFKISWFHLGADIEQSLPSFGLTEATRSLINSIDWSQSFLMVGTLEPRKGHAQTLNAFELLWKEGMNVNLIIVGKKGWFVDELVLKITSHSELNRRLFWFEGISDECLGQIYSSSYCIIVASEGEGFGLPLIEAAKHKLNIIARDIPVFREIAGEHAYYFSGLEPQALATCIKNWLALKDDVPLSRNIKWLTWKQSSAQLVNQSLANMC